MAKFRYHYNPITCKYEHIIVSPAELGRRTFYFLGISILIGLVGLIYFNYRFPLLDETLEAQENASLKTSWQVYNHQLDQSAAALGELENNDDNNFRVILDLEPLSSSQREAGVGGHENPSKYIPYLMIKTSLERAEKIKNRLDIESQSFHQLKEEIALKEKMWASRPAIQPISNKDLKQLYTTYGMRLHPVFGYWRDHKGLDFSASEGKPVYATGNGKVEFANGGTTYGNVIYLNHGFGFQTRYAHLSLYVVSEGQEVKRGQIIGYVGNTGLSGGSHLHYEVLYKGNNVNPISFFQLDLNNKEFEKMIEGAKNNSSLD